MRKKKLVCFFDQYIQGTQEKAFIIEQTMYLCRLSRKVNKCLRLSSQKIYITTKCLKHLYDRKPAQEFEVILKYINNILELPLEIYSNKQGKAGDYVFVNKIGEERYLAVIEISKGLTETGFIETNYVVTCFKIRDENYLKSYKLLWSWKDGTPSS